jgi:hypothetical protein
MKKYLFVLVSFSFLMVQCIKDDTYDATIKVSGKVLQFGTLKPVVNAKVFLINEKSSGTASGSTSSSTVDTVRTDAAGFYQFSKTGIDKNGSYIVTAAVDKYFPFDPTEYLIANATFTKKDIILTPHAWIKVYVKNQNPFDDNDKILFGNVIGPNISEHIGKNVELNYLNRCSGNTPMIATWGTWKNGLWKKFTDTIVVPAHDTLSYRILY